jgi:prepilin-type N-terminal cleavage/methylation domain-containing protein
MKKKLAFSLIELSVVILVIGILVIGITKGSRIMQSAKISKLTSLSKSSPIASMANLVMWYDATSKDSYSNANSLKDGDTITTLKDLNPQSTNKINLTGTATYLESAINGLPAIDFNGSSQYF